MPRDRSILLVESDPASVALTIDAFERNNFSNKIVVAVDGAEALEQLLPADGRPVSLPAVVILDLDLPDGGGLDVLRRLRASERTHDLPIVILTSSNESDDRAESYRLGANSFVTRPKDTDDLAEAVRLLAHYWLELNQTTLAI